MSLPKQVFAMVVLTAALPASAQTSTLVELSCSWSTADKPNPATAEAARFYLPGRPLRFSIDLEKSELILGSSDELVLGFGLVTVSDDDVDIRFEKPKIKGLMGRDARIAVTIDRYDLTSLFSVATRQDGKNWFTDWWRHGSCRRKVF
jgi:hypothetical protein